MSGREGKIRTLHLGLLPVDIINSTLELELEVGEVIFAGPAQIHAARRHPEDFPLILPHLAGIIANPLYLGDDWRNAGKIEIVGRVTLPDGLGHVLVAVSIEPDHAGRYHVVSTYRVSARKVAERRAKMHLRSPR